MESYYDSELQARFNASERRRISGAVLYSQRPALRAALGKAHPSLAGENDPNDGSPRVVLYALLEPWKPGIARLWFSIGAAEGTYDDYADVPLAAADAILSEARGGA